MMAHSVHAIEPYDLTLSFSLILLTTLTITTLLLSSPHQKQSKTKCTAQLDSTFVNQLICEAIESKVNQQSCTEIDEYRVLLRCELP
jgi:hypothetical protein